MAQRWAQQVSELSQVVDTDEDISAGLLLAFAFIGIPLLVDEYLLRAILIPFLILSLAALGLNIAGDEDQGGEGVPIVGVSPDGGAAQAGLDLVGNKKDAEPIGQGSKSL